MEAMMKVTIEGAYKNSTWVTMEQLLRETLNCPQGRLTRISRPDGKGDYWKHGEYNLRFTNSIREYEVTLVVK